MHIHSKLSIDWHYSSTYFYFCLLKIVISYFNSGLFECFFLNYQRRCADTQPRHLLHLFLNANEHLMKASGFLSQKYEIENKQHLFIQNFYRKNNKTSDFWPFRFENTFNTSDCRKTRNTRASH